MFYEPAKKNHGLRYAPLKAIVAPRPIGWISSLGADGVANLAPYSFFNMIADTPPLVMFSSVGRKDSVRNIEATGEFVCNLVTLDLLEPMNATSAPLPPSQDEFEHAGLEKAPSILVRPPRVARAKAALECLYVETFRPKSRAGAVLDQHMVIGEVVGVHVDDAALVDGRFDLGKVTTVARCGYQDYAPVDRLIALERPPGAGG